MRLIHIDHQSATWADNLWAVLAVLGVLVWVYGLPAAGLR